MISDGPHTILNSGGIASWQTRRLVTIGPLPVDKARSGRFQFSSLKWSSGDTYLGNLLFALKEKKHYFPTFSLATLQNSGNKCCSEDNY